MLTQHIALVPEAFEVNPSELARVAAALQIQIRRDVGPRWNVNAAVDAFARLEDVPSGHWPIVLSTRVTAAQSRIHVDYNGQPYARVELSPLWSLQASRLCIEMLTNQFGLRATTTPPRVTQGPAELLVEAGAPAYVDEPTDAERFSRASTSTPPPLPRQRVVAPKTEPASARNVVWMLGGGLGVAVVLISGLWMRDVMFRPRPVSATPAYATAPATPTAPMPSATATATAPMPSATEAATAPAPPTAAELAAKERRRLRRLARAAEAETETQTEAAVEVPRTPESAPVTPRRSTVASIDPLDSLLDTRE